MLSILYNFRRLRKSDTQLSATKKLCAINCLVWLSACSSIEIDPAKTSFNTRITDTRLKHFEVKIKKAKTELPTNLSENPEVRRRQIQKLSPERLSKQLEKAADFHIAESKFCRTGYWVIETNTYNPTMSLRAECNEPASDQDIAKFPNTFKQW